MSTIDIANGLVAKCRAGDYRGAMAEFYHRNIVSIEGDGTQVTGLDACYGKGDWWSQNFEVHSGEVAGPFVETDQFAVRFTYDVTNKQTGKRTTFDEMALYLVHGGRIVREQFFYRPVG